MTREISTELEALAINTIRMLSVDAVQKANSGHPGLPMGAATMAYVLWTEFLKHNPADPDWPDRDRFVLSAGHGSALLYSLLHLTGYDLPLQQLQQFRQLGSLTPGHPERIDTPGVEVTTGPLGQGFANSVGLAIAEAFLAARYNGPDQEIFNHYTYGICSDGDLMEGVAMEAAAIAGHLGLGKLIFLYDSNRITLAGTANVSMSDDVAMRFTAAGWHVTSIDGMDPQAVRQAISAAQSVTDQPSLIIASTEIGFGSPHKAGTFGAHGSPLGAEEVLETKANLGWPLEPAFFIPEESLELFRRALALGKKKQQQWQSDYSDWQKVNPAAAAELTLALAGALSADWDSDMPVWTPQDKAISTRKASEAVIQKFFPKIPTFIGGSADLNPSTNTAMKDGGDFLDPKQYPDDAADIQGLVGGGWSFAGRNIHWGIREHAMGSAVNGIAAHGGLIPFGATFLVFSDYLRPAIRLAALSELHSIFVFTHDSIAVGEDGPTHEPIEQVMSLRLIPNLTVIRPADANETADAWRIALEHHSPTVLILSRQDLPILDQSAAKGTTRNGGYVLVDSNRSPEVVLIATGSEVSLALQATQLLQSEGIAVRVVSMPSWELFESQPAAYRSSVLGKEGTPRVSVEAGTTIGWQRYTGSAGAQVGIDTFGASGPGEQVMRMFRFTPEHVAATALRVIGKIETADRLEPQ